MKQVTLVFLQREGQILLAMKKRDFGKGKWNGAGGKVMAGETVQQSAARECKEEIGVKPGTLHLAGRIKFYMADDPDFLHDCTVYTVHDWEGEPQESDEMRPQWFAHNGIPYAEMWPDDAIWLPLLLKGTLFAGDVTIDGDRVAKHSIAPVKTLEEPANQLESDSLMELRQLVWKHLEDRDWDHPEPRSLAISLSLEANELLEHYQWHDKPVGSKTELGEELADVLIYALQYAHVMGIDPAAAIRDKLKKSAQKYPAEQFKGRAASDKTKAWLDAKLKHREQKKGL